MKRIDLQQQILRLYLKNSSAINLQVSFWNVLF